MILQDVMTTNPKTCHVDDSIHDCARTMADNHIGFLPVVNDQGQLMGTITDRDITIRAVAKGNCNAKVRDVYSDKPVHLNGNDALAQAESLMMDGHIRRLVIVDEEKKPIGIVSASNLVENEPDNERVSKFFRTVLEPQTREKERTVEGLVGSSCCG